MNSQAVHIPRAKQRVVFTDLKKRDLKTCVAPSDDVLLLRWERIAEEIARG